MIAAVQVILNVEVVYDGGVPLLLECVVLETFLVYAVQMTSFAHCWEVEMFCATRLRVLLVLSVVETARGHDCATRRVDMMRRLGVVTICDSKERSSRATDVWVKADKNLELPHLRVQALCRADGGVMFSVIVGAGSSYRDRPGYVSLLADHDEDLHCVNVQHGGQVSNGRRFAVGTAPCCDEDDTNRRRQCGN